MRCILRLWSKPYRKTLAIDRLASLIELFAANLKRAENHRASVTHAIATNSFDYTATFPNFLNAIKFADQVGDVQTFEVYLEAWLRRQRKHLKASTYSNGYRKIVVGQLIPWFGAMVLSALRKKTSAKKWNR